MKSIILSLILFLTNIVYGQKTIVKTVTIYPHLSFQNYEHFKRLTLSSSDPNLEHLAGFKFDWGYTYKLRVKQTQLYSMLSDGTKYEYSFDKQISKTKVNDSTEFTLTLDGNIYYYEVDSTEQEASYSLKKINDTTFLYFEEVEIEVPQNLMEEFNLIVAKKRRKVGTFSYVNEKKIRLIKF